MKYPLWIRTIPFNIFHLPESSLLLLCNAPISQLWYVALNKRARLYDAIINVHFYFDLLQGDECMCPTMLTHVAFRSMYQVESIDIS